MNAQTESVPAAAPVRFIKIGADGKPLPVDATGYVAVLQPQYARMWAVEAIKVPNWKPATVKKIEAQIAALRTGGFDDWRVPNVEEMFLLADRKRFNPAIDTEFFPDCPSDWFWTSDDYAPDSGCAWCVGFNFGYSNGYYRLSYGFVRAVRGGQ